MYTNVCIYLDGVPSHFTERWWGMKTFSIFKMGSVAPPGIFIGGQKVLGSGA